MKKPIQSKITGGFWQALLSINSHRAIHFQWQQLEKSGCIENFRICAGKSNKPRTGLFFSDSDAYKWLDAACRILRQDPQPDLQALVDGFVKLIQAAQADDGYLYTYNQILFPGSRWKNLQIEHELYCMGHLIEAGISHRQLAGQSELFSSILKMAELICREFHNSDWTMVDGHEEIEIALLKLAEETGQEKFRSMAEKFLFRRKAGRGYGLLFIRQAINSLHRMYQVAMLRKNASAMAPANEEFVLPARNQHKTPWRTWPRLIHSLLSGKYAQRDEAFNIGEAPVGHAVRFTYLETATAMLARQKGDTTLISAMETRWHRMVSRRMYVTGGIGSLPLIEGFGRDFELDPRLAYTETCAALGSLFWNREMALLTGNTRYDDLLEWQLYNAIAVGFGRDGCSYLYNNPLISAGQVHRAAWYDVPCCPSNISRTWASLGDYLYSAENNRITIHQYVTSEVKFDMGSPVIIRVVSGLPWQGEIHVKFELNKKVDLELNLRYPSWAEDCELRMNGSDVQIGNGADGTRSFTAACGVEQKGRRHLEIKDTFADGDEVLIKFGMALKILHQDSRIRACRGLAALSRGPVVYCLEDCDNPGLTLPPRVIQDSLIVVEGNSDFEGIPVVLGKSTEGIPVRFIPYYLWGNRGKSKMSVFFYPM
jgi:hypothetical protein